MSIKTEEKLIQKFNCLRKIIVKKNKVKIYKEKTSRKVISKVAKFLCHLPSSMNQNMNYGK